MNSAIEKELRELVEANIISQETADEIEAFYRKRKENNNRFPVFLSIIGTILVALGIVLVVAHNWDDFSRSVRTVFAFLPLAISQLLCFYVIRKKINNVTWKEGSATFLFFSVGTCLALMSQIYHMKGNLSDFLFTWMWLAVPLVYILSSFVVTLLYIGGITWYACYVGYNYPGAIPYWYFAFLLVLLPSYLKMLKRQPGGNAVHILHWFAAFSFACCFGSLLLPRPYELIFIGYIALFGFYYLIGTGSTTPNRRVIANSFFSLGLAGVLVILTLWSFDFLWDGVSLRDAPSQIFASPFPYLTGLLFLLATYLLARRVKHRGWETVDPIGISVYVLTAAILLFQHYPNAGILVVNFWLFLTGLYFVRKGSLRSHFGILNFGLIIIFALALFRFFDDSIPFVWRGIIFVGTGVMIFAANYILMKRKKSIANQQP